ncbi:hypothetical protein [Pseudomonas sp. NDM]|uniref:hypothetical protein n=1 Tax=Pseudomonas sp. NDM TaxID=2170733 RepID=UPI00105803FA|nr:hypothetical protein [Pseudomonas sp. NDM]
MKAQITFGSGCAISNTMLYVPSFLDELDESLEHTRMFVLNLETSPYWFHHEIREKTVVSTCFRPESAEFKRACYSLTNRGVVEIFNSDETIENHIFKTKADTIKSGDLTNIKFIGQHAYACGSGNQVYKNLPQGWSLISSAIKAQATQKLSEAVSNISKATNSLTVKNADLISATKKLREYTILNCIDGLTENSIYTCGTNGKIWHWDGSNWQDIKSGTKQHLHHIHCTSDDTVLMCGHNGTILTGNYKSGFRRLPIEKTQIHFWSIKSFRESIYLGSNRGLFTITNNQITPCMISPDIPSFFSVQSIDVRDNTLWVVADKFILRYHSNSWDIIEHPDNI